MMSAATPSGGFKPGVVEVTPPMAQKVLENAAPNRNPSRRAVVRYKGDMLSGAWDEENGETIKFHDGKLVDGIQRMSALVMAGLEKPDISIKFLVVDGVSKNAMLTIDTGVGRTFANWLKINEGLTTSAVIAAAAHRMYQWDVLGIHAGKMNSSISHVVLNEYFKAHLEELVPAAEHLDNREIRTLMPASVWLTVAIILRRIDLDQTDAFLTQLRTGANLGVDNAILGLRDRLKDDRKVWGARRGNQGKAVIEYPPQETARALTFIGWNLWRDGRNVKIQLPKGDLAAKYPMPR